MSSGSASGGHARGLAARSWRTAQIKPSAEEVFASVLKKPLANSFLLRARRHSRIALVNPVSHEIGAEHFRVSGLRNLARIGESQDVATEDDEVP